MEFGYGGLDGAGEIWEFMEHEGLKKWKIADVRWDLAGEAVVGEDGEGDDPVGGPITFDTVPMAAICLWVPRGEDVGIVEGFFDIEEDFFVIWIAKFC